MIRKKTHLQLLFSVGSHWVCCYYDSRKIIIYDSYEVTRNLNRISPDSQIIIFLKALFPFYDFQNNPVQFPEVQNQQNGRDCGLFAMAFAISALYGLDPCKVKYDDDSLLMRNHLLNMLEEQKIV